MQRLLDKIQSKSCIIEIFGLGYVGFPLAVKLSSVGFKVVGIDVSKKTIDAKWTVNINRPDSHFLKVYFQGFLQLSDQKLQMKEKMDHTHVHLRLIFEIFQLYV